MPKAAKVREDISVCCDRNLTSPILKNGMAQLIELSRNIRMKPSWVDTTNTGCSKYSCSYKGKRVVYYAIDKDSILVTITLTEMGEKDELKAFYHALPDELKRELAVSKFRHCTGNGAVRCHLCDTSVILECNGTEYGHCTRFNFIFQPTTDEHFEMIEQFINLRRQYIGEMGNKTERTTP